MTLPRISGEYRVVADPDLRFGQNGGTAVCRIRVVANSKKKDDSGTWVDDKVVWLGAVMFKDVAEHAAESIKKGDTVLIDGRLETQEWEDKENNKRQSYNILVDNIGVSIRWNNVQTVQAQRATAPASEDPWSSAPAGQPQQQEAAPF